MLKTTLRDFQNETVQWMQKQEADHDGGLLLNEPGTGKTICCLKLMLSCKSTTLVVCPSGLVQNWVKEIKKHTLLKDNEIFVYTGQNRKNLKITNDHIVFITSYNIIARDTPENASQTSQLQMPQVQTQELQTPQLPDKDSIFTKTFTRTILDEAHYIRNWNRKTFKSVMCIKSNLKWIVTATPIFNKVDDIYSYFRFLELESIDSRKEWYKLTHSAGRGILTYKRLNDVMKSHSITMTKSQVLSNELQPKNQIDVVVELKDFEKEFYESLWSYSMQRMQRLTSRLKILTGLKDIDSQMIKKIVTNNILVYILRLKQSCNNPWLVISKMHRLKNVNSLRKATEMLKFYNSSLNMEEECPVCFDNIADAIASPCGHKCCQDCWDKIMRHNLNRCPKCRSDIESIDRVDIVEVNNANGEGSKFENEIKESSKIKKLMEIISEKLKISEKVIIVSQWVKMLDITRGLVDLKFSKVGSVSLQGDVSMNRRQDLIEQFQSDPNIKICYVSLMSSAEGINLTAANNVVLLDKWWNTSKMIQVSDRVHRIGQTRDVNVYSLVVGGENSIEERIGKLVSKKERLKNLVMKRWTIDEKKYDDDWIKLPVKLIG